MQQSPSGVSGQAQRPLDLTSYFHVVYGALLLGGAVLSAVFFHYFSSYRSRYLGLWSAAFAAMALAALCTGVTVGLIGHFPAGHPARLLPSALAAAAVYLQVYWLVAGIYEFATGRELATRWLVGPAVALATFGLVMTLLYAGAPDAGGQRFFFRVTLRQLLIGGTVLAAALALFGGQRTRVSFGARIVALSLLFFGLAQLLSVALTLTANLVPGSMPLAASLTILDTVTQFSVGLGLVIWLLEKERSRAHAAGAEAEFHRRHDQLTRLPNRDVCAAQLSRLIAGSDPRTTQVTVVHVGLDRFKQINSSFGRWAGDEILRQFAERIRGVPSTGGFAGRLASDEFLLVQGMKAGEAGAQLLGERVRRLARKPFEVGETEVKVDASVGVSIFPQDSDDAELLLKQSDLAMQRIKASGGRGVGFYAPELDQHARRRYRLEQDFHRALNEGDLELVFQPIIRSADEVIIGAEALARWRHPELGLLRPDLFLPSVRDAGMIGNLDRWALREALGIAENWHGRVMEPFLLAVNASPETFQDEALERTVAEALEGHDITHLRLELEITEQTAIQDLTLTRERIRALEGLGVQVALDDFGIGYSSLGHLQRLRTPVIKLDRTFVGRLPEDEDAATILEAVVPMLQKLGRKVVAEGVQSAAQAHFARRIGVDYQQGFYYYKPLATRDFEALLQAPAATGSEAR